MADEDCYIIGIDFGTTYSGVAWCWSAQPENVELVTRWPSRLNFAGDNAKTPTQLYYNPGRGDPNWGYDIPPEVEPIKWFKLLLLDDDQLTTDLRRSTQIQRAREQQRELGKTATTIVADYLRLLWKHVTEEIVRDRGKAAFDGSRVKVWITVPAIWDDNARKRMRQAAKMAGMLESRPAGETTLDLVAEPEAAAMAVLDDFKKRKDIEANDIFIVCDAGGGTVDIISYTMIDMNPTTVQECVEGKGKMCGAIFVDEAFENLLTAQLGEKWKRMSEENKKLLMTKEWEFGIKRMFDDSDKEWSVQVPAEALAKRHFSIRGNQFNKKGEVPMKEGQLKFKQGHIRTFFETVCPQIRGLIHDQRQEIEKKYNKQPKAILLVGGLGSCNYLFQQLKRNFEPKGISVLQPNGARPWSAICRGAVMCGLSAPTVKAKKALVVSRVSRINYGVNKNMYYDESKHIPSDRFWDAEEMKWKATNQMDWYLKKGDTVYTEKPVRLNYYRFFQEHPRSISIDIWHNDDSTAPSRKAESVKLLRTVKFRVRTPFEQFPEFTNPNGAVYRRMNYSIEMSATNVSLTWKVWINGEEMGSEDVQILNE